MEILVKGFIFSVIAVPILVLVLSVILYFKFPKQRDDIGIIVTSVGSVEMFLYVGAIFLNVFRGLFTGVSFFIGVILVEIVSVLVGVITFKK